MPDVARLIRQSARRHGVDPRAAIAVARGEGGLRFGAVGDQGTSYGPFQLHRGGALPAGRGAAWANSAAGINYALSRMAASGARGLTGAAAVEQIIRGFERPADPDTSIRNAIGRLGTSPAGSLGSSGIGELPDIAGSLRGRGGGGGAGIEELPDFASQLGKKKEERQFKIPGFDLASAPGMAAPALSSPPPVGGGIEPSGGSLQLPASFKSTHQTDNLGWPAIDIMGAPGTAVRTPVSGTIIRHGSAQGGESLYLDTNGDGEGDYWLGHVTQMAPVGSRVRPGQVVALISPDHPRPHAHWAKR